MRTLPLACFPAVAGALMLLSPAIGAQEVDPRLPWPMRDQHVDGLMTALMPVERNHYSVMLARVRSVVKAPPEDYERVRRTMPGVDPDRWLPVQSGVFEKVEHLSGPPSPATIAVDNTAARLRNMFVITDRMREGAYWIVSIDTRTGSVARHFSDGTSPLTGPGDPFLAIYRDHLSRLKRTDDDALTRDLSAAVLATKESIRSRLAALITYGAWVSREASSRRNNRRYPLLRSTIRHLLSQADLPDALKRRAIGMTYVDCTLPISPDSDEAWLLKYLLRIVATGQDASLVQLCGRIVSRLAVESTTINGKLIVYFLPQVLQALERRVEYDRAVDPAGIGNTEAYATEVKNQLKLPATADLVLRDIP